MRNAILLLVLFYAHQSSAQNRMPGFTTGISPFNNFSQTDSLSKSKWSVSRFAMLSNSFLMYKGGNANMLSVMGGLQLNRKLNNNWYAFANIAVAPTLFNFNTAYNNAMNKPFGMNPFGGQQRFGNYTAASLGLMYINNDKTFSISGSFSVQRSNYPMLGMYQGNSSNQKLLHNGNR